MSTTIFDHEVMLKYERHKRLYNNTVTEFTNHQNLSTTPQLQLELIALDIEIRLTLGDRVEVDPYYLEFPHLGEKISKVYYEVKSEYLRNFCPLEHCFGCLPENFAGYRVISEISRGGMGVVYRAERLLDKKACAIKVLFVKRNEISEEAKILTKLDHPNVCQLIDIGLQSGTPFLCMELIEGKTLQKLILDRQYMDPLETAKMVVKIADGLHEVHQQGIIHFDVNSRNIMLNEAGDPVLMDFGLATLVDDSNPNPKEPGSFGTPGYVAPERIDSRFGQSGACSDVFGLGTVLYELLTGIPPFRVARAGHLNQTCHYPPSRPSDFENRNVDSEIEGICLRALSKHVSERTPSMLFLKRELELWIGRQELVQSRNQRFLRAA